MARRTKRSGVQKKEDRALAKRAVDARNATALLEPVSWHKSWSATHPPYYGTELCPDRSKRG